MPSQPLVFVMQRRPRAVVADDSHFMRNVITDILEDGGASTDDGATAAHDPGGSALATDDRGGVLVRIRESERQIAIRCDSVNAQEEVVVKPLEGILSGTAGLSGTAVLGDGNIVHILDVVTL